MLKKYFELSEDARIALHIVPADQFQPKKNKINILFTMWEWLQVPISYIENLQRADLIIVPSRFCKDLFRKYTKVPIEVCYEGIEPSKLSILSKKKADVWREIPFLMDRRTES
jgi:hypothetical protein